jgi:hypothetical protein
MTNHVQFEKGDGNGNPSCLRISWTALSVMVAALSLLLIVFNGVRSSDMRVVQDQIALNGVKIENVDRARLEDKRSLEARLDRIQAGVEAIRQWQIEQGICK